MENLSVSLSIVIVLKQLEYFEQVDKNLGHSTKVCLSYVHISRFVPHSVMSVSRIALISRKVEMRDY